MATFYANQQAGSTPSIPLQYLGDRVKGNLITSRLSIAQLTYTMVGTEAAADVVRLFLGKQGMNILSHLSQVYSDAIAATATLDIGDLDLLGVGAAVDPDRYADGLDVAAAGWDLFSANSSASQITPYYLGSDAWIEVTFKTLVTPVADKKLEFLVFYGGA